MKTQPYSHRKPKAVDKTGSKDDWRQVITDMRQALGFGSGRKKKKTQTNISVKKPAEKLLKKPPSPKPTSVSIGSTTKESQKDIRPETTESQPASENEAQETEKKAQKFKLPFAKIKLSRRKKIILGLSLVVIMVVFIFREDVFAPWPPAPNVVASFDGGQITIKDVEKHLASLVEDEEAQKQLTSPQGYSLIVQEMITDEIVRRWQQNRKPDQDQEFSHIMKHISEEINLNELHAQMHQGQLGVTEGDIQAYYEANKDQFGEQTLTDVREQIRTTLQSENEDQFVQNYITGLKNRATITKDLDALTVPEPADWDLKNYYDANQDQFVKLAEAQVHEIQIPKVGNEKKAKEKADQALSRIRSGSDFGTVYQEINGSSLPESGQIVIKGEKDTAYDDVVFSLDPGQISEVITSSDTFYVVQLISKETERQLGFEEVRSQIRNEVLSQKEEQYYADSADKTLFTVNGKRFTLGEFWEEYQELPVSFLTGFSGTEGKQALVERIIERLLLFEDSLSQVSQTETKERKDEMRLKVLAQMLEQEEVDDKIEVEDKEIEEYYNNNKARLVMPPKSKVRQIAIRSGETEDEHTRAYEKATEAYKKLVPGPLKKGEDFSTIAKQYSEDEETKDNGGEVSQWIEEERDLLGEITKHQYHEQVSIVPKGEISQPFEANGYIYIVEVLDRTEPEPLSLDDAKEFIRERLTQEKHAQLSEQLSEKMMKDAKVTIYIRTLKKIVRK
jgi:parvulin-like peptidyl-prolyl isomerase